MIIGIFFLLTIIHFILLAYFMQSMYTSNHEVIISKNNKYT